VAFPFEELIREKNVEIETKKQKKEATLASTDSYEETPENEESVHERFVNCDDATVHRESGAHPDSNEENQQSEEVK
jgi:CRISPR/Cas system CSM-associated protein Csm4 (group 5 of RAMP superfamily)